TVELLVDDVSRQRLERAMQGPDFHLERSGDLHQTRECRIDLAQILDRRLRIELVCRFLTVLPAYRCCHVSSSIWSCSDLYVAARIEVLSKAVARPSGRARA